MTLGPTGDDPGGTQPLPWHATEPAASWQAPFATSARPRANGIGPAPYGVHPLTGMPFSDRSRTTAGLLQIVLPLVCVCGVGRLYAGHIVIGLIQLIGLFVAWYFALFLIGLPFLVGIWVWSVIDGIMMLAGDSVDADGRLLR